MNIKLIFVWHVSNMLFVLLEELGEKDLIASSKYDIAVSLMENGDYLSAYNYF